MKRRALGILANILPKGLYARALIIIIAPVVLLQSVVAFVFMERHWQTVTRRLSDATTREISMLLSVYEAYPHDDKYERLIKMARENLGLSVQILPSEDLPTARPKPFFDLLDRTLSENKKIEGHGARKYARACLRSSCSRCHDAGRVRV